MFSKTVTLIVRYKDDVEGIDRIFPESTEVGIFKHWKTPSAFIDEFKKMYRTHGGDRFQITNVIIG